MKQYRKYFLLLLLIFAVLTLGFIRDTIFVNINKQLGTLKGTGVLTKPFAVDLFNNHYYLFKWLLTISFSVAYLVLACLIIYLLYKNKKYIRYTVLFHLSFEIFSFIAIVIGRLYDNDMFGYRVARDLMGMAQSPILVMILVPAFKLLNANFSKILEDKK